jgi:hypothetical protein
LDGERRKEGRKREGEEGQGRQGFKSDLKSRRLASFRAKPEIEFPLKDQG